MRTCSVAVCVLAVAAIWIAAGISNAPSLADDDSPNSPQQPSSAASGKLGTVTLTADQQQQIGLQTTVLQSAAHSEQIRAYGAVLDVARITDLTNSYANAQAQLQTARARFDVAKSAFERAQSLVRSAILAKRDAEAAEGTYLTDQAALVAAESQLKTLAATAQQEWGSVLGKGIVERSPQIVRLIERDQFLVQVTLPPGVVLAEPPEAALAQAPTRSANIDLHFVSPATRTDARIQGLSYFFVASGDSSLLPGMNTIVYVPSGKSYEGVFLEDTAIVQWQGRSWVYLRVAPDSFKRHPINTDQPVSDDDYVVQDIPPGSEIVVRGAQVLLSEEAKSELRGSGDND